MLEIELLFTGFLINSSNISKDIRVPCSIEQSFLGSLRGQERNVICEENRESGSMHPLSERDRAKKDYGKVELVKSITITLTQRLGKCADNIQDLIYRKKEGKSKVIVTIFLKDRHFTML